MYVVSLKSNIWTTRSKLFRNTNFKISIIRKWVIIKLARKAFCRGNAAVCLLPDSRLRKESSLSSSLCGVKFRCWKHRAWRCLVRDVLFHCAEENHTSHAPPTQITLSTQSPHCHQNGKGRGSFPTYISVATEIIGLIPCSLCFSRILIEKPPEGKKHRAGLRLEGTSWRRQWAKMTSCRQAEQVVGPGASCVTPRGFQARAPGAACPRLVFTRKYL